MSNRGYTGSRLASKTGPPPKGPKVIKNTDFFKIGGDKTVTVSVTFDISGKANEEILLRNAAEAIAYYANNKFHKTWTRKIEVK